MLAQIRYLKESGHDGSSCGGHGRVAEESTGIIVLVLGGDWADNIFLEARWADSGDLTSIDVLDWTASETRVGGDGALLASGWVDVVDDKVGKTKELTDGDGDRGINDVPEDNLRTRRSRQGSLVGEHGRFGWDRLIWVEAFLKTTLALVGSPTSSSLLIDGGAVGVTSEIAVADTFGVDRDLLPIGQEILENTNVVGVSWLEEETDDGESTTANLLVDQVHARSEVKSINSVVGSSMEMELKNVVWDGLTGDDHAWDFAVFSVVTSEDGVVGDGECDIIKSTRTGLKK